MRFDIFGIIYSPYFILFILLFFGMWLGNLKCLGRMKLGVGGPLFAGLFIGWGLTALAESAELGDEGYAAAREFLSGKAIPPVLSTLMLMLFVASVGLLASENLDVVIKKYGFKFIVLGVAVTFAGAALSYVTTLISDKTDTYEASGIYVGALTSSPGQGAAQEKAAERAYADMIAAGAGEEEAQAASDEAVARLNTGYSIAYPFGMISVILAMSLIPKIFRINVPEELRRHLAEMEAERAGAKKSRREIGSVHFDIKSYAIVCLFGYLLGMVQINMGPLGYFSLSSTGGVLIASVIFGYIGKIGPFCFRMDKKTLGSIKDLALACYIGIIGVNYGYTVIMALPTSGIYFAIASLLIAFVCIIVGYLIGHYAFHINWIMLSGAICGGMTSTPGLGMATDSAGSDEPAAGYAAAYPFALIGMVLFTIIMYSLP